MRTTMENLMIILNTKICYIISLFEKVVINFKSIDFNWEIMCTWNK
jgi:hypothetical protein